MTGTDAPPLAGRREWLGLGVLGLATMLTMMDINVLFLALPRISADLDASSIEQLWITDIYGFLIAGFLVTMGTLADRVGRRKVLLLGATAFTVLSVVAAFSTSPEMLIIMRALLGVAGATIMPCTLSLIMSMFPHPKQMGAAIGIWSTAMMAGITLGPIVGGLLLSAFWWGSVFLLAVPVMVLVLVTGPALLPEGKSPWAGKIDLASVALSLLAILPFIYGLKEIVKGGWTAVPVITLVVGIVFGVIFVRRQKRLEAPLLDLNLFRIPAVGGALVVALLFAAIQGGNGLIVTLHLQLVEGFSPLKAALWMLIPAGIMVIGIQLVNPVSRKVRPGVILMTGMLIGAVGMITLTQVDAVGGLALLIIGASIVFLGGSPIGVLANQLVMGAAPPEKAGSAASLNSTGGELGLALGIAGVGTIAVGVYQSNLVVPEGVPAESAAVAQESIAGAHAVAGDLAPPLASDLLAAAGEAFTSALNSAAGVLAAVFVGLAAIVFFTLRKIPIPGPPPGAPEGGPEAQGDDSGTAEAEATAVK